MIGLVLIAAIITISSAGVLDSSSSWEDIQMICPNQCVCQRSHFMDLSIARWTHNNGFRSLVKDNDDEYQKHNSDDNEAFYEDNIDNPYLKFSMCILNDNVNFKDLVVSLPSDIQALVILFNGEHKNLTVASSDLLPLNDLTILEIRGNVERNLKFVLDEPLTSLEYGNFESIELFGTETSKNHDNSRNPMDYFDYVPESERQSSYNISFEVQEDIKIVPYDIYLMEKQKAQMPSFYGWQKLEVLRIHNCKLNELHWEMFDGLLNLKHLSLEYNNIKIVPPFAFYGANNVKTLSLARNEILDLHYRALAGLLELEWLDLSVNNLTKLSELSFPPFPKLQSVDFRKNPIQFIFPMTFAVMNDTKYLFFDSESMAVDLSIGHSFSPLSELNALSIGNVSVNVLTQSIFKGLKKLEKLKLRGHIKRIEFDAFAEVPNVRELVLKDCGIQEISMDMFFGVRKLELVDMSENKLQYLPPGLFDEQKNLKEIYLQKNQLSELPNDVFTNPSVQLIRLIENPWFCTCDMLSWNQAITNRMRSTKSERKCITNLKTGEIIKCTEPANKYNYIFDNKLSPRCDGGPSEMKHRNVYYSIRHNAKCNEKKRINKEKLRNKTEKYNKYMRNKMNDNKLLMAKKLRAEQMSVQKIEINQENDLQYLIQLNQRQQNDADQDELNNNII